MDSNDILQTIGVIAALSAIFYRLVWVPLQKKQDDKIEIALAAQRNEFQAGYFDLQEKRYTALVKSYIELEKRLIKLESKANP